MDAIVIASLRCSCGGLIQAIGSTEASEHAVPISKRQGEPVRRLHDVAVKLGSHGVSAFPRSRGAS